MSIFDMFSDVFSSLTANDEMSPGGASIEWHNDYGTAADYRVPAESDYLHPSNTWANSTIDDL